MRLEEKKEQYNRQVERAEEIALSMQKTNDEMNQLKYTLEVMERIEKADRKRRVIRHEDIRKFMADIKEEYDYLLRRFHLPLTYQLACEVIYARYLIESRTRTPGHEYLSYETILTYFKQERGMR